MSMSWRQKIIQTIILGMFFVVPLVFFPMDIWFLSLWYERYKIIVFLIFSAILGLLLVADLKKYTRIFFWIIGVIFFFFVWKYFWDLSFFQFLFGTEEKRHGILFFWGLVVLFFWLKKYLTEEFSRKIENTLLFSGGIVALYSLFQAIWIDFPTLQWLTTSWWWGRVFSTLGNPNYLAWFFLILLPIAERRKLKEKIIFWILFLVSIFLSGSIFGIVLWVSYILYSFIKNYPKQRFFGVILSGILTLWIIVFSFRYPDIIHLKFLSLLSRFSLWIVWFSSQISHPIGFILGYGPDSVFSSMWYSILDSRFFQVGTQIDSFHNIFLDLSYFFGIPTISILTCLLLKKWKNFSRTSKEGIFLFVLFFFLNIPVAVHFLILIYLFTKKDSYWPTL